jgi:hypothetical protein
MSVSKEARTKDLVDLLTAYVAAIGDRFRLEIMVGPHDDGFMTFLPTTWVELEQGGLLAPRHTFGTNGETWELTADGWLAGLELSGQIESTDLRERAVMLAQGLKALVKGRSSAVAPMVDERDLGPQVGLPVGWVRNALECNLLNAVFPTKDMTVEHDNRNRCFRVPPLFGLERLGTGDGD